MYVTPCVGPLHFRTTAGHHGSVLIYIRSVLGERGGIFRVRRFQLVLKIERFVFEDAFSFKVLH